MTQASWGQPLSSQTGAKLAQAGKLGTATFRQAGDGHFPAKLAQAGDSHFPAKLGPALEPQAGEAASWGPQAASASWGQPLSDCKLGRPQAGDSHFPAKLGPSPGAGWGPAQAGRKLGTATFRQAGDSHFPAKLGPSWAASWAASWGQAGDDSSDSKLGTASWGQPLSVASWDGKASRQGVRSCIDISLFRPAYKAKIAVQRTSARTQVRGQNAGKGSGLVLTYPLFRPGYKAHTQAHAHAGTGSGSGTHR